MARVAFSAILNSVQGSVGGSVFQKNRSGFTLKNKSVNVNKNSSKQNSARRYLSELIIAWQGLSDTNKSLWENFANFHPVLNKNNVNVNLTGYQLFLKYNLIRLHSGLVPLLTFSLQPVSFLLTDATFYNNTNELILEFEPDFNSTFFWWLVSVGSPKISRYPGQAKKYAVCRLNAFMHPYYDIAPDYVDTFGRIPAIGEYIPYKLTGIMKSQPVIFNGSFNVASVIEF